MFTCVAVSSLVGMAVCVPTHRTANTDACKPTILHIHLPP